MADYRAVGGFFLRSLKLPLAAKAAMSTSLKFEETDSVIDHSS